jgi:hypothetical protein
MVFFPKILTADLKPNLLRNISLLLPTRQTEQPSATLVIICLTHMQGEYSVILTEPISCPERVPSI